MYLSKIKNILVLFNENYFMLQKRQRRALLIVIVACVV